MDARVEDPDAFMFDAEKFVEVAFVIVPLVALMSFRVKLPAERLVIVAEVIVALVPTAFVKLEVEALVVVANRFVKYEVPVAFTFVKLPVPLLRVPIFPVIVFSVVM